MLLELQLQRLTKKNEEKGLYQGNNIGASKNSPTKKSNFLLQMLKEKALGTEKKKKKKIKLRQQYILVFSETSAYSGKSTKWLPMSEKKGGKQLCQQLQQSLFFRVRYTGGKISEALTGPAVAARLREKHRQRLLLNKESLTGFQK